MTGPIPCVSLLTDLSANNNNSYMNRVLLDFEKKIFAVQRGYSRLFDRLVEEYPDPNEQDSSGRTLLHLLASRDDFRKCRKLIDIGADPNLTDSSGNVPLPIWNNNGDDA